MIEAALAETRRLRQPDLRAPPKYYKGIEPSSIACTGKNQKSTEDPIYISLQ